MTANPPPIPAVTKRDQVLKRVAALDRLRSSWLSDWIDINSVLLPRRGNFMMGPGTTPQAPHRNTNILDNSAIGALTTLQAGMHSGMTSPARPWLKIETADGDLMESKAVSVWCDRVTQKIRTMFSRSNAYRVLHGMYGGIGAYGTSCSVLEEDYLDTLRFQPLAHGEFSLGVDDRGEVNTMARRFPMTVGQICERYVDRFRNSGSYDWSVVSPTIKNMWDRGDVDVYVPVTQLLQPRKFRDPQRPDKKNMPFESIVLEDGANADQVMHEGGYLRFPVVSMRWYTEGQDIYGSNYPGLVSLGDIQQLQMEQLKKAKAIDYQADPPIVAPTSMRESESDFLPGGVSYADMNGPNQRVQSAFDVPLRLDFLLEDLRDVRGRIKEAFYADLFLFLSNLDGRGDRTAREVAEIHEEKLLILGPVVENIEGSLHHMVDIAYDIGVKASLFPPPPPEIAGRDGQPGVELKVEFIGLLSQAQRAVSMTSVDRIIAATASIATAMGSPEPWDKIDTDIVIDKAAGYLGTDPEIIRGAEDVKAIRDARAQAQKAVQQAAAAQSAAETAKSLAGADMSGNNALTNVTRGFSPVQ